MELQELVNFLDSYLELNKISFEPSNGLQVKGKENITRIALAVDPCIAVIKAAASWNADLLLTHHPLITEPIEKISKTEYPVEFARLEAVKSTNLSVYCVHLPLDRHPEVGNAVTLAKMLNLEVKGEFGEYKPGTKIGCWAQRTPILYSDFAKQVKQVVGEIQSYPYGSKRVQNVGIMTGSGLKYLNEAKQLELDTYISGTPIHQALLSAEDLNINVIFGGHYATEQFGVQEVGIKIKEKFVGIKTKFIPHPTPT